MKKLSLVSRADEGEEGESDGGLPKGGLGDSVQKR